ncbi:cyclopropane fatty acyl phospholipid synthase [Dehalogenimonas etheniformans]|uniref:Cyclopropane-fatty-acyl-phospholipid synthase n=1 Tax=Dehalogenimonas etheniformans TaxID=1536648 RepID=A0A2P5P8A3_9CHLR|nr:cyclopropane fatty acyl phospholipid synthase [Dehalogenimonas etheniformans]PPD58505.1 cyclopropane-fatty-acyl-phospholipid synthase [Dehalogenimonas etheniformans]QNT76731.1 cyclopropane fatty acyl phospholipid synthase [Dehalogenimonas etheniformans]
MSNEKGIVRQLFSEAEITPDGDNVYDPQIHDPRFYKRVLQEKSLGLGEAYMDGWWDCQSLDQFFHRLLAADLDKKIRNNPRLLAAFAWNTITNPGRKSKAFEIGQKHYDIGNDLYRAMLDKRLTYTCGYWKDAETLDDAQESKLDLVCRKINLRPGQKVLDIGSGWGCFIKFASERYEAEADGVTVSKEQKALADEMCCGIPARTQLKDYRDIDGKYDHVVSLGMFEHVGHKNYRVFMKAVNRALSDGGLFLLHTIGGNKSTSGSDPWITKYIFPNSMIPSMAQITRAIEGLFVLEDCHSFGADYDRTLMAWHRNFTSNWPSLSNKYDERFYRMWTYFLLSCAGSFRARKNQLWQLIFSKRGVAGGYRAIR